MRRGRMKMCLPVSDLHFAFAGVESLSHRRIRINDSQITPPGSDLQCAMAGVKSGSHPRVQKQMCAEGGRGCRLQVPIFSSRGQASSPAAIGSHRVSRSGGSQREGEDSASRLVFSLQRHRFRQPSCAQTQGCAEIVSRLRPSSRVAGIESCSHDKWRNRGTKMVEESVVSRLRSSVRVAGTESGSHQTCRVRDAKWMPPGSDIRVGWLARV